MALIETELGSEQLTLRAPGMEPLRLERRGDGPALDVEIWRDRCPAVDQGDEATAWLSSFLGAPVRLVRQCEGADRRVDPEYARAPSDQVSFADGYPFLLAAEASLDDLNGRLPDALPMNRFRPNLVVAGSRPFEEDGWRVIRVGEIVFDVVKPCARCVITTVDQATGRTGKEPLRTLATFRSLPPGRAGREGGEVYFGQNLIHREGGTLEVGSPVEVLEEVDPGRD